MKQFLTIRSAFVSNLAIASLNQWHDPAIWGRGKVRWKRVYRATRAFNSGGRPLLNWALHHNPYLDFRACAQTDVAAVSATRDSNCPSTGREPSQLQSFEL